MNRVASGRSRNWRELMSIYPDSTRIIKMVAWDYTYDNVGEKL
jgi:hypothetical protein